MKHTIRKCIRGMGAIEVRQMLSDMHDEMIRVVMSRRNCINRENCKWVVYRYGLDCLKNSLDHGLHKIPFEINMSIFGQDKDTYKIFNIGVEVLPYDHLPKNIVEEYYIKLVYDDTQNYHEMFSPSMFYTKELLNQYYGLWRKDDMIPEIKRVIFNQPATIVLWKDGSKTVVNCQEGEAFDPEKGLAMCIIKKISGNKGNFNDIFRKWIPEEKDE